MDIRDENGKRIDPKMEGPEQELANTYIRADDCVLELGARYGSVSCLINSKLNCKKNHVAVEPDERVWNALEHNRSVNNCDFHIVKGFVSNKKLSLTEITSYDGYGTTSVENKDTTIPSYSLKEIQQTYDLSFNVIVADCEGFLESFLDDNPDFPDNLRLIIFEADYPEKCNYTKIRSILEYDKDFTELLFGHQNVWIKS
jgi:FkbM family methyltransferase